LESSGAAWIPDDESQALGRALETFGAVIVPEGDGMGAGVRLNFWGWMNAAIVLARRGNEQACQAVLAEVGQVYGQRVAQLRQARIEPGQVISWRQRLILASATRDADRPRAQHR